jgi:hypothetical protein
MGILSQGSDDSFGITPIEKRTKEEEEIDKRINKTMKRLMLTQLRIKS